MVTIRKRAILKNIFISYRRADSIATAGRIRDRLVQEFGREHVFVDVDDIPYGEDFEKVLAEKIDHCSVLLAIIGPNWQGGNIGQSRLHGDIDYVGVEIGTALARGAIAVIPVLVDGARMPTAEQLPDSLKALTRRNGIELRNTQFGSDAERLVSAINAATSPERTAAPGLALMALGVVVLAATVGLLGWPLTRPISTASAPNVSQSPQPIRSAVAATAVTTAVGNLHDLLLPANGRIRVAIRGGNRVKLGEQIVIDVNSRVPGQLILIDLNAADEVTLIFPNRYLASDAAARVASDTTLSVPGPGYGFSGFKAVEPIGKGQLIALVAPDAVPQSVFAQTMSQRSKGFEPVNTPGPYLTQLVDQIRAILLSAPDRSGALDAWGFSIVDYEIVG